jgi:hypothetical protein
VHNENVVLAMYTLLALVSLWTFQNSPAAGPACREWHECQRLAMEAYERREYEPFHDLAWRAVQTGPPRSPELMYLLARAQSLSGRPHDALVMLERLAELKFATAPGSDDDFRAVRQLPQWPELEAMLVPAAAGLPASGAPLPSAPSPPAANPVATAVAVAPRQAEETIRIAGAAVNFAGLTYDRVSSRFVVADENRRNLMVIDERSHHVIDLVTAESAGFNDITSLEIDPARGDLWVVSADPSACALHKVQLVSGRPLDRIPLPAELEPCRVVDLAVTPAGRVLLLDVVSPKLIEYRQANHTFRNVTTLQIEGATSLASAGERVVYIAHRSGIARVDVVTGAVESLAASPNVTLSGFERIRWTHDSLAGVQRTTDGRERAVRIRIAEGRATTLEVLDDGLSAADRPVGTVSGDDFYLLTAEPSSEPGAGRDLVIRRSRVR